MKVIDLLNKIANGEEMPKEIIYDGYHYSWDNGDKDYYCEKYGNLFEYLFSEYQTNESLNFEIETLDEEEEPLTKKDLETLGYACGEIKKCIEKGFNKSLNNEPLEDDDKDIPLIPDDELYKIIDKAQNGICEYANITHHVGIDVALNYNFKVLHEKINQVVKEFNEYRKENE